MNREKKSENGDGKDVRIIIDVSLDKMEAYVTITVLKESPDFSVEEIKKALSDKGIKFGIKEEVLVFLEEEVKYNEKILIASGLRPKDGIGGEIDYLFDVNKVKKVGKGEKICEIIPRIESVDGMDIFGEKVAAEELTDLQMPNFINVEISSEEKKYIVSKVNGYVSVDKMSIMVSPFFEMEEVTDQYEAYIKVRKPLEDGDFTEGDLRKFLEEKNIVFGIKEDEIKSIFEEKKFDQRVLIGEGEKVVDGESGKIKFYFDPVVKPKMDEQGNINYKELNLIQNVKKGAKLTESIPPKEGVEGCTVFGKKIQPKKGLPTLLPSGNNTVSDPGNPNILLAEIDGNVKLKGNKVEVEPAMVVKGDVDYSTGNIDFVGSVIVNGDVKSGFKIRAKKDVQVNGVVEDALIMAGGDVLIKTGFIGRGNGKIVASGKVMAKFCDNQNIICGGDVIIGGYVMHSNIQTRGSLVLIDQNGLIVGGEVYALKGIEAKIAGNKNYTPTALYAGIDRQVNQKVREKVSLLAKNAENSNEVEKALNLFSQRKLIKKSLSEDRKKLYDKLVLVKDKLEKEEKQLLSEMEELQKKLSEFKDAVIKIIDVVYPGTSVTIYNRHISVKEAMKYVYFKYVDKEVVVSDLSEFEE